MNHNNYNDGIVILSADKNIMFSSTGEITINKKSIRKNKIKNMIHPIFDSMKKYTKEDFWIRFLTKASRNVFPNNNFKYMNNVLHYKIKTKKHRDEIFIDDDDLENSFLKLKLFLRSKGTKPSSDVNKEELLINFNKTEEINEWKDIKKEAKFDAILKYLKELSIKYNIHQKEKNKLESMVRVALSGDIFNNDNIIIKDRKIINIKHLVWNENINMFTVDIDGIKIKCPKSKNIQSKNKYYSFNSYSDDNNNVREIESINIGKKWEKYLENFYKAK